MSQFTYANAEPSKSSVDDCLKVRQSTTDEQFLKFIKRIRHSMPACLPNFCEVFFGYILRDEFF